MCNLVNKMLHNSKSAKYSLLRRGVLSLSFYPSAFPCSFPLGFEFMPFALKRRQPEEAVLVTKFAMILNNAPNGHSCWRLLLCKIRGLKCLNSSGTLQRVISE